MELVTSFGTSSWHFTGSASGSQLVITLVATISNITFFSLVFSLLLSTFVTEGVLRSKNLFSESKLECEKHRGRPCRPFWGTLAAILDFTVGERVPLALLGWYCKKTLNEINQIIKSHCLNASF